MKIIAAVALLTACGSAAAPGLPGDPPSSSERSELPPTTQERVEAPSDAGSDSPAQDALGTPDAPPPRLVPVQDRKGVYEDRERREECTPTPTLEADGTRLTRCLPVGYGQATRGDPAWALSDGRSFLRFTCEPLDRILFVSDEPLPRGVRYYWPRVSSSVPSVLVGQDVAVEVYEIDIVNVILNAAYFQRGPGDDECRSGMQAVDAMDRFYPLTRIPLERFAIIP